MAKKRGWWKLDLGDLDIRDLSDADAEHIAKMIKQGYTEGEVVCDE
jgi:hypothetical protein